MIQRMGLLFLAVVFTAVAANAPDFSGTWIFNAGKSKNVGMMASAEYTSTITQTAKVLTVASLLVSLAPGRSRRMRQTAGILAALGSRPTIHNSSSRSIQIGIRHPTIIQISLAQACLHDMLHATQRLPPCSVALLWCSHEEGPRWRR